MEIIDRLGDGGACASTWCTRLLLPSGTADLSIVIRTAIRCGDTLTIGAGGGAVLDSTPAEEYEEMLLKASAPLRAYRG